MCQFSVKGTFPKGLFHPHQPRWEKGAMGGDDDDDDNDDNCNLSWLLRQGDFSGFLWWFSLILWLTDQTRTWKENLPALGAALV